MNILMETRNEINLEGGQQEDIIQVPKKKPRAVFIDWMRPLAISLVIFVHSLGVSYDSSGYNVKKEWQKGEEKMRGIWKDLLQIGIPMFFYISGFAASFFKTEKKFAYKIFVWGKCTRIFFPFLVAIPLFLIPALWLQRSYANTRIDGALNDDGLFTWYYAFLTQPAQIFNHISWLWYLPAMFIDFLLIYPLLRWTKRRAAAVPFGRGDVETVILQLITTLVWMLLNKIVLGNNSDGLSAELCLKAIAVTSMAQFSAMAFQLLIPKSDNWVLVLRLWGPITCCLINLFKNWKGPSEFILYDIFLMVDYDAVHFSQGVMDMIYWEQMERSKGKLMKTVFAPLSGYLFLFIYSVTQPSNSDPGQLWYYPLMKTYILMCFHVIGTYLWLYSLTWYMQLVANEKFNEKVYKIVCDSALWTYVTHYFWITVLAYWITMPLGLSQPSSFFVLFFGTHILAYSSYQLLIYLITKGWQKKAPRSQNQQVVEDCERVEKFEQEEEEEVEEVEDSEDLLTNKDLLTLTNNSSGTNTNPTIQ